MPIKLQIIITDHFSPRKYFFLSTVLTFLFLKSLSLVAVGSFGCFLCAYSFIYPPFLRNSFKSFFEALHIYCLTVHIFLATMP